MPKYLDLNGVAFLRDKINEVKNNKISYQMRTAAEWNQDPQFMSAQGVLYIYMNYGQTQEGQPLTGLKIGDGNSYVIDLPFISGGAITSQEMKQHIQNQTIHITQFERNSWNNKVTTYNYVQNENLIFSRE